MSSSKPKVELKHSCQLCGSTLTTGSLKYILKLEIWADFDGHLPEVDDPSKVQAILREMEEADPIELEEEVHLTRYLLICPTCRLNIMLGLKNRETAEDNLSILH
ncbi:MAG: hypothetical protein NT009_08890 [Proteobacteria bacterium]|nr:hypothetical protein [Pseudomonadota bacterium]